MTVDELNDVLTFYFDWMIRNLLVPGRIESWLVILDLNGVGFSNIPMGRLGDVSEVASTYSFLASDEAAYINGAIIEVGGGATL